MTNDLIADTHCSDETNHAGISKTFSKLSQKYYWPNMFPEVREYVNRCVKCKERKPANDTLRTPMGGPFNVQRPFQHVYMDFLGPYPRTKLGNVYVLVLLDQLSKYPIFMPLRQANSALVCNFLEKQVFSVFNVPQSVYTDNASQFTSSTFKSFLSSLGIRHLTPPKYSPQSNASERTNKEIVQGIAMQLQKDQSKWDETLNNIAISLRSTTHQTIGCSPHYALFGSDKICHGSTYELLSKLDALKENDFRVVDFGQRMNTIHSNLMENFRKAHEKSQKHYNLRSRERNLQIGQTVYRKLFHLSSAPKKFNSKLAPKFSQCRVKQKLGNSRYILEDFNGKELGTYHTKDIKQ